MEDADQERVLHIFLFISLYPSREFEHKKNRGAAFGVTMSQSQLQSRAEAKAFSLPNG